MLLLPNLWAFALISLSFIIPNVVAVDQAFENINIQRTVELGGSFVYVTRTFNLKALRGGELKYRVALSVDEQRTTSWIEARLKTGDQKPLTLGTVGVVPATDGSFHYTVNLPPMKVDDTVALVVETIQTHASYPWPASVGQAEAQDMKYRGELFVLSPYVTQSQETRFKGTAKILNYTSPSGLSDFTSERPVIHTGSSLKYGPFKNVPITATSEFERRIQQAVVVHYEYDQPVLTVTSLRRSAEISHWGSNLNIQDEIQLRNDGPKLKGQFSRIDYQMAKYQNRLPPHVVEDLTLHLPPGIYDPYFYDLNGNVSTSRFRPSPKTTAVTKSRPNQYSYLQIRPRFPLLGGWNYTFTLGWDAPLADSAKWNSKIGKYVVAIPFWTPIPGAVVDEAEVSVVLPEGATDIEVYSPNYVGLTTESSTHVTYLDTIGRPKFVLTKSQLTDKHTGLIFVAYKLPLTAHLRKPIAITLATFGLFFFNAIARRVDLRIHK